MSVNINAVRVFVIVVRAGSFTRASEVLHVTQGAVSQQIAKLETYMGMKLFNRDTNVLSLTTPGLRLFRGVANSIERIDAEVDAQRSQGQNQILSISTFGSFAAQWLVPRLEIFGKLHPYIRIHCDTTTRLIDYVGEGIDLGVRFGSGVWDALHADKLLEHKIYPVAKPQYIAQLDLDAGAQSLANLPLYYDLETPTEWSRWFGAMDCQEVEPNLTKGFSDTLVMLSAVLSGVEGVALIGDHLTEKEIEQGRLARVFDGFIKPEGAYFLVYPTKVPLSPAANEFKSWLLSNH